MRAYLRGYYRENREALLVKQKERREADIERTRAQTRAYYHRNLQKMRTRKREQYTRKNNPTVHERALEIYGFSIDQVTRWIEDDPSLATAFARSLDSGQLSKECLSLLAKHGASVAA